MQSRGSQFANMKNGGGPAGFRHDMPTAMQTHSPEQQGFQYPMFRPAGKLRGPGGGLAGEAMFNPGDLEEMPDEENHWREESEDEAWDRKLDESMSSGVFDSVEAYGVKDPVLLSDQFVSPGEVKNGHHRIAAAAEINPKMEVPVSYGPWQDADTHPNSEGHRDEYYRGDLF